MLGEPDSRRVMGASGARHGKSGNSDFQEYALRLYLDFIYLFLMLLRLFGDRRE